MHARYTLVNVPGGLLAIDLGFQGEACVLHHMAKITSHHSLRCVRIAASGRPQLCCGDRMCKSQDLDYHILSDS